MFFIQDQLDLCLSTRRSILLRLARFNLPLMDLARVFLRLQSAEHLLQRSD
jgi:hypothetical protein